MADDVPAFGYRAYGIAARQSPPASPQPSSGWQIESRQYRVDFDPQSGAIRQIHDKALGRDLVDAAVPHKLNELLYVSGGENTRVIRDTAPAPAQLDIAGQTGAELVARVRTPFGERIHIRAHAPHLPEIDTEVSVYDDLKRIDIANRVRKEEVHGREAVYFAFPFQVSRPTLAYQIQNAWVRPNTDQLPGAPREWFATQNAVVARGDGVAIGWGSPDAPLITLTDIDRGRWLRSLDITNAHVYSWVMNNYWSVNYKASQGGDYRFRYFITSGAKLGEPELAQFSVATRSPLVPYDDYDNLHVTIAPATHRMPLVRGSFFTVEGCSAEVTALKQAEDGDGVILRLHEHAGGDAACRLESPVFPVRSAVLANGVEQAGSPLPVSGNAVRVPVKPHQFATVRLRLGAK
jgi:hypothetical protein